MKCFGCMISTAFQWCNMLFVLFLPLLRMTFLWPSVLVRHSLLSLIFFRIPHFLPEKVTMLFSFPGLLAVTQEEKLCLRIVLGKNGKWNYEQILNCLLTTEAHSLKEEEWSKKESLCLSPQTTLRTNSNTPSRPAPAGLESSKPVAVLKAWFCFTVLNVSVKLQVGRRLNSLISLAGQSLKK